MSSSFLSFAYSFLAENKLAFDRAIYSGWKSVDQLDKAQDFVFPKR